MLIREEEPQDAGQITQVIRSAFHNAEHSSGTESQIVDSLRHADAMTISLVAVEDQAVVGHVAISPVRVGTGQGGWYGLGPVSVRPDRQGDGIGSRLTHEALRRLRALGAAGCVVLGNPAFYGKFGFKHDPRVTYADIPPPYFQVLSFGAVIPNGAVRYHAAFDE